MRTRTHDLTLPTAKAGGSVKAEVLAIQGLHFKTRYNFFLGITKQRTPHIPASPLLLFDKTGKFNVLSKKIKVFTKIFSLFTLFCVILYLDFIWLAE